MREAAAAPVIRPRRPGLYVLLGLVAGVGYALLNTQTDDWARGGGIGRAFAAFHAFVDRGIPLVAGALLGLAFHWVHLRGRLAEAESARANELRSRLRHVERDQAVWVVAASALHELKNPLHTLGLLVDELIDTATSGDRAALEDLARRVRAQVDRTLVPLDALRALARPGPRARRARPAAATVEEVIASLQPLATEADVALRLEGELDTSARVDAEYLRIILDNLVANALEGREGAVRARNVVVRMERAPERIRITISDDGPGLDCTPEQGLFEPLRTAKESGLGLGLPIARALARTLGGDLSPVTVAGFSTSFQLDVPERPGA